MGILGQPTVTDLGKAKHPLHDTENMLHLGPDFRFGPVTRLGRLTQGLIATPLRVGKILRIAACRITSVCPV